MCIYFDNWIICGGLDAAQASLHTILFPPENPTSLQTETGPLGWDNWFCISQQEGWNNIQDGRRTSPTSAALPRFWSLPAARTDAAAAAERRLDG